MRQEYMENYGTSPFGDASDWEEPSALTEDEWRELELARQRRENDTSNTEPGRL